MNGTHRLGRWAISCNMWGTTEAGPHEHPDSTKSTSHRKGRKQAHTPILRLRTSCSPSPLPVLRCQDVSTM